MKRLLLPAQLRRTYTDEDLSPILQELPQHRKVLVGQDRAVKALRFGLGNRAPGFNVYVSVPDGDSMFQVIRHFLEDLVAQDPVPSDWCYVNNFSDPYCPNALQLPRGKAREFKEDVERFIEESKTALVKTFESEEYAESRNDINQKLMQEQQALFSEINEKAQKEKFGIKHSPAEILVFPMQEDGQPLTDKQFLALDESQREEVMKKRKELQDMIRGAVLRTRDLEKQAMQEISDLERRAALFAIEGLLDELRLKHQSVEEVPEYLEDLKKDILQNIALFLQDKTPQKMPGLPQNQKGLHQRYEVNVLVDNQNLDKATIITELNPTYNNLFGKIERESVMGTLVTNFTLIRPGALHQANGGYLILPIDDLLRSPFAWDTLKRALRNQRIEIEDPTEKLGFISAKSLKPEPIPLNVQIILIGHHRLFRVLYEYDRDFRKLFKVKGNYLPQN